MAHDVFISHSTEDKPAADAICAILEENGVRCWIAPRDIMPGADWGESIVNGIRTSRVLLLVFSTNANKSKQIKREVEIAADGGLTIVYTVDGQTDYFGHKNASTAFIQQDLERDATSYKYLKLAPDLSTFKTTLGHDSIEYDSDALDVRGKQHKGRCRLEIYYTPTSSPRLQSLSLKVLRN